MLKKLIIPIEEKVIIRMCLRIDVCKLVKYYDIDDKVNTIKQTWKKVIRVFNY